MDAKNGDSFRSVIMALFSFSAGPLLSPCVVLRKLICLQLVNHGITVELLERVKKVCSECYRLRAEGFKGSKPVQLLSKLVEEEGEAADAKRLDDVDWEDVFLLQDDNEWPSNPPEFRETMKEYREELRKLAEKVMEILKDGQWIDVQPVANAIVINTGDQIEVLSNGLYKSVWHRVLTTSDGNRRSIASFYNPSLKATIAPGSNKNDSAAALYPKYVFGDYMDVYVKQKFSPKEPRFEAVKAL
ncbi:hypothetical protein BHM03_00044370 [Ensete ventricosum]|nr:hypothetical protein BHM03_00044370 [Ensete ventricosum]